MTLTPTEPYRVAAPAALALAMPAAVFAGTCFIAMDRHSHSVSDTLYGIYPFWGTTFLLWDWLVRRLAEAKRRARANSRKCFPTQQVS